MRIKLDSPIKLSQIQNICGGLLKGDDRIIKYITTDSREVEKCDLFIALKGEKYDGNDYSREVVKKGGIVLSDDAEFATLVVNSTREALLKTASMYKAIKTKLTCTIAITGSVGKTTTKEFTSFITSSNYNVHATKENENNDIGLARTLLSMPNDTELLICEMGMNHSGEIESLSRCANPDIAVITNIGCAHYGNLGSRNLIADAKLEIRNGMKSGILLIPAEEKLFANIKDAKRVSTKQTNSDYALISRKSDAGGSHFDFFVNGKKHLSAKISIPGNHILSCIAYALSICAILGISTEDCKNQVEKIGYNILRQKVTTVGRYQIFDDTYSSSPEAVIATMRALALNSSTSHSAVLGDMLELGKLTVPMHEMIGREAYLLGFKKIYAFGVYASYIEKGALEAGMNRKNIKTNMDITRPDITADQIKENYNGELILFKASHSLKVQRIFDYLK